MKQSLRALSLIICFTFLGAENVMADPIYTAPDALKGFIHIGNRHLDKKVIGGIETNFLVADMNRFLTDGYNYTYKSNDRESEYRIFLPDDADQGLKHNLDFFFGNDFKATAWLEFRELGEPVEGVNLCHYSLKARFPQKDPSEIIDNVPIMMRRILPTFAAMDTNDDFETHLTLDNLGHPFGYNGKNYQFNEEQIHNITMLMGLNLPVEANDEVNPPVIAHPISVLRTYWDEKTKKMEAILFVNDEIIYECNVELAHE